MNILVAGSRSFQEKWEDGMLISGWTQRMMNDVLTAALDTLGLMDSVGAMDHIIVHGGARGVDQMAGKWALDLALGVDVHPADWEKYGKRAGYLRNAEMVKIADAAIIVWDKTSKGTQHSIRLAHDKGIPYVVVARSPLVRFS